MSQLVLCVKTEQVQPDPGFRWLKQLPDSRRPTKFNLQDLWLVPRQQAEQDESFLQIIPYVVVFDAEDAPAKPRILSYLRRGTETRLHNRRSIGFGGHIDQTDLGIMAPLDDVVTSLAGLVDTQRTASQVLRDGALREVQEELGPQLMSHAERFLHPIGVLFDPTEAVGRVHLGVVFTVPIIGSRPTLTDTEEVVNPAWLFAKQMLSMNDSEQWTRYLLEALPDCQPLPCSSDYLDTAMKLQQEALLRAQNHVQAILHAQSFL